MNAVTLTITLDDKGFRVQGPLADPLLCFGLLKMAETKIQQRVMQGEKEDRRISVAHGINLDRLRTK